MCSGDDNPPRVMSESRPRARKEHRCCECGRLIPPGTRYVRTWGIWDDPDEFKQHIECRELLEYISDTYCGGESWSFGTLRQEVREYTDTEYFGGALACRMAAIEARYPA